MNLLDVIEQKRDGHALGLEHWETLARTLKAGRLPEYQVAALNAAAKVRGLTQAEVDGLHEVFARHDLTLDWMEVPGIGIDVALYGGTLSNKTFPNHAILRRKLAGEVLTEEEIQAFIGRVADMTARDADIAAFAMAVFLNGMTRPEVVALTRAMLYSGEVLEWKGLPGPAVDKHSTGGVGDKVSLPLAGLLAACGLYVPMISGRGLGHTGGTLDKMQSIPGCRVDLSPAEIQKVVREQGAMIIGQTRTLAPADRRVYAIRDVTGTVSSIPLITASILSKKLAEGISSLVLDVKSGSGAFMPTLELARALARSLVEVGRDAGVKVSALLTPMDQPLGNTAGNANEVAESVACLRGEGPADLEYLVVAQGAELLFSEGKVETREAGEALMRENIRNGKGLACFRAMVAAQGGDPRTIDDPGLLPQASMVETLRADRDGYLQELHALTFGRALIALGGGRRMAEDVVDPAVGFYLHAKVGAQLKQGDAIVDIHANDPAKLEEAREMVKRAIRIGPEVPTALPLVLERL